MSKVEKKKTRQFRLKWSQELEHKQGPKGTESNFQKGKLCLQAFYQPLNSENGKSLLFNDMPNEVSE